jgi:hypothetical protein
LQLVSVDEERTKDTVKQVLSIPELIGMPDTKPFLRPNKGETMILPLLRMKPNQ